MSPSHVMFSLGGLEGDSRWRDSDFGRVSGRQHRKFLIYIGSNTQFSKWPTSAPKACLFFGVMAI